jgi:hypothetical protein
MLEETEWQPLLDYNQIELNQVCFLRPSLCSKTELIIEHGDGLCQI